MCPVNPDHEQMLVVKASNTQYCPDRSHDGNPSTAPGGKKPPTRKLWPLQYFQRAVDEWRKMERSEPVDLPDIELGELLP